MTAFTVPAPYARYIEAELALALANVARDADRRSDEDPAIQRLAWIPEALIDQSVTGIMRITVEPEPALQAKAS